MFGRRATYRAASGMGSESSGSWLWGCGFVGGLRAVLRGDEFRVAGASVEAGKLEHHHLPTSKTQTKGRRSMTYIGSMLRGLSSDSRMNRL